MTDHVREPRPPVRQALDALADHTPFDWDAVSSPGTVTDPDLQRTLAALRDIAQVARAHVPVGDVLPLPTRWGPLDVIAHLARGAHGDVYLARDRSLQRDVALKLLRDPARHDADQSSHSEGIRLARVRHPNVVTVHGADRIDGRTGLWMELVDGETLHHRLAAGGPLPASDVVATGVAVCAGLSAIHAAGLVHGDVKAQNVMRDRTGRIILMDLGAGRRSTESPSALQGTPLYLAPEVLQGASPTAASDIYAVGVLLHVLATGTYPIEGDSLEALQSAHRRRERSAVADERLPGGLASVIDRAMALRPAERYASASSMQAALERTVSSRPRTARASFGLVSGLVVAITAALASLALERAPRPAILAPADDGSPRRIVLPAQPIGPLSGDGCCVPYVDGPGNIRRYRIATREDEVLVPADEAAGSPGSAILARDGSRAAYAWRRPDAGWEVRTSTPGGEPRVLLSAQWQSVPTPLAWSADGRTLLVALRAFGGSQDVVALADGAGTPPRPLLAVTAGLVTATVSADGNQAAIAVNGTEAESGVSLVNVASGVVRRVHDGPAVLPRLAGAPTRLFFVRREPSGDELWTLPIEGAGAAAVASLVEPALGGLFDLRVTDDGVLWRLASLASAEVYTAPFDVHRSPAIGGAAHVDPAEIGNHVSPSWSPDGRHLAYFTIRQAVPGMTPERTLTVQDVRTGRTRRVQVPLSFLGGYTPRWTIDGRHVAVWGRDTAEASSWGYYRVEVITGETTPLVRLGVNAPAFAQFSPDGRSFLYTDPRRGIVSRDLGSGREGIVVKVEPGSRPGRFALSPDGGAIAFMRHSGPPDAEVMAIEVQRRGSAPVVRVQSTWPKWLSLHAWTPDGAHLLYARGLGDDLGQLWSIGAVDGLPHDLKFRGFGGPSTLSVHPGGRRIAFPERVLSPELVISRLPTR
ncbi:hypothetical protein TBR22_A40730 [Luteitalea sp. TBR-22]|uniref:protein kinase domain-containing protein n=1 Tax=Luteitalea sp. TBR-22 TaxID=2802971 RepID=UPI001AF51CE0|nr:protein kinase [Luteitalea sp. TBR-22]BCS34847.1 hypothetical protein TBR22_A40730 [Luteitalea sp. TBR-22]